MRYGQATDEEAVAAGAAAANPEARAVDGAAGAAAEAGAAGGEAESAAPAPASAVWSSTYTGERHLGRDFYSKRFRLLLNHVVESGPPLTEPALLHDQEVGGWMDWGASMCGASTMRRTESRVEVYSCRLIYGSPPRT